MNTDNHDPLRRALADLDSRLARVSAEVAEMRAGLASIEQAARQTEPSRPGRPETVRQEVPQSAQQWAPQSARQEVPQSAHQPEPESRRREPVSPLPGPAAPPPHLPYGMATEPKVKRPRRVPRLTASMVIAAIGGAVMLAGIAFLLIVAVQAGFFPPVARVAAAAVLAAALVWLGVRLRLRSERSGEVTGEDRVDAGALALVGTGFAAAILDVIASTTLYEWIPVPAAYVLVGVLAIAGMVLARRWESGLLAWLVSAGTMLLAPLISTGVELPVFVVILAAATAVLGAELGTSVRLVWSMLPALFLTGYLSGAEHDPRGEQIVLVVAALAFAAVGYGVAWFDSTRRTPAVANAGLAVVPTGLPLLYLPAKDLVSPGWLVAVLLAAAYLVGAYLVGRGHGDADWPILTDADDSTESDHADGREAVLLSAMAGLVGSVLLFSGWVRFGDYDWTALAFILSCTAYALAAVMLGRRWLDVVAGVGTVVSVLFYSGRFAPSRALLEGRAVREFEGLDVLASAAFTVLALAVTWWAWRRLPRTLVWVAAVAAVVALFSASAALVALGVVLGRLAGDALAGFLVAHLVVTVLWICCAAWSVLTSRTQAPEVRRIGFVLGSLALAKLLLLDLATLPGLFRVLSFIAVGAVMLAVAVRYRGGRDEQEGPEREAVTGYRSETDPSGSGSPT